jgi:hypothetical protein
MLRPALDTDLSLVIDSWRRSIRDDPYIELIPWSVFESHILPAIVKLARIADVLCLSMRDEPDQILAWACFDKTTLHYMYCKQAFRRLGFATLLMLAAFPAGDVPCSAYTQAAAWCRRLRYTPKVFKKDEVLKC